jgi:hypothetical protein
MRWRASRTPPPLPAGCRADAPALSDALAAIWALARRTLWGLPPLALRKL